jgi:hypothetical protein
MRNFGLLQVLTETSELPLGFAKNEAANQHLTLSKQSSQRQGTSGHLIDRLRKTLKSSVALAPQRLSVNYAGEIRNGPCVPHKRHWLKLAKLVGFSPEK